MDDIKKMSSEASWHWTNERHLHFLDEIEASFVRAMFQNERFLRLDRELPDTSDSTQDLARERRRRYSTSDVMGDKSGKALRTDKKTRRRIPNKQFNSSQDQVVPQVGNRKDDKDDNDHLDVTPPTPSQLLIENLFLAFLAFICIFCFYFSYPFIWSSTLKVWISLQHI